MDSSLIKTGRILLIGNIAGNSYNLAKGLRRRGYEVDCFSNEYSYHIGSPEWESADFSAEVSPINQDWSKIDTGGFVRPPWFFEYYHGSSREDVRPAPQPLMLDPCYARHPLGYTQQYGLTGIQSDIRRYGRLAGRLGRRAIGKGAQLFRTILKTKPGITEQLIRFYEDKALAAGFQEPLTSYDFDFFASKCHYANLFDQYDLVQAAGLWEPGYLSSFSPSRPFVVFEHGTLRDIYDRSSPANRLYVLACYLAGQIVVTNADGMPIADRMGLAEKAVFIPHPVDDTIFYPTPQPELRRELLAKTSSEFLIYAPSRHDWAEKGNDLFLKGLALARRRGIPAGAVMCRWGNEIERSCALIRELNLDAHVTWIAAAPKPRVARHLNASDVLVDQFFYPAFGTVAAEGLACGKPVVMKFHAEMHRRVFNPLPPIIDATSPEQVAEVLVGLHSNSDTTRTIGEQSAQWFREHHSLELVMNRHLEVWRRAKTCPRSFVPL